ncbi:MAG: YHS domain-containing (seleno)protein [Bdellovibrionota bacterium]
MFRIKRKAIVPTIALCILSLGFSLTGLSKEAFKPHNLTKGLALQGYDPVTYFKDKSPQKGMDNLRLNIDGATYQFSSQANLEEFKKNPEKYAPQFGGWCAYAMADADYVDIDPLTYKITDGKLYVFYNGWLGNTLKKWNKDEANLLTKANNNWQSLREGSK